jgi:hypothetical protein
MYPMHPCHFVDIGDLTGITHIAAPGALGELAARSGTQYRGVLADRSGTGPATTLAAPSIDT